MDFEMRLEWGLDSRTIFDQLQESTQKLVYEGLGQLAEKSFLAYQRRANDVEKINMVSHLQLRGILYNRYITFVRAYQLS